MEGSRFSRRFYLQHKTGEKLYPVRIKDRDTGKFLFRVSEGGTGGNTKKMGKQVEEQEMVDFVKKHGYAVRVSSLNGKKQGLYKAGHRSVTALVGGKHRVWISGMGG